MPPKINLTHDIINDLQYLSQEEVSKKYHISRPTLSKRIKENNYQTLTGADGRILHTFLDDIELKRCGHCHYWYRLEMFSKLKKNWDGLSKNCKFCSSQIMNKHEKKHPGIRAKYTQKSYIKHKPKKLAYAKAYRQTEAGKTSMLKERSKVRNAYVYWSRKALREMIAEFGRRCAWCDSTDELELEHFIPIALGGKTIPGNIYYSCKPCNRGIGGKADKHPEQYSIETFGNNQKYLEIKVKLMVLDKILKV